MPESRPCPSCGAPVQVDWNWCHACGYDPANRKPEGWTPTEPLPPPAGMVPLDDRSEPPSLPRPPAGAGAPGFDMSPPPPVTMASSRPRSKISPSLVIVVVVAVLAAGTLAYVVTKGSAAAKGPPAATAFSSGLPILFKLSDDDPNQIPIMPATLAGCTQAQLSAGDVAAISALQSTDDLPKLPLAVQIRAVRAARTCDRVGVAQAMTGQGAGLSRFGVNSIDQQLCLMEHYEDSISKEDPSTTAFVSDASSIAVIVPSFQACVPLVNGLQALIISAETGVSDSAANCMANAMAPSESWLQIFSITDPDSATDNPANTQFQSAVQGAAQSCGVGG